jgi:hypothetical protein
MWLNLNNKWTLDDIKEHVAAGVSIIDNRHGQSRAATVTFAKPYGSSHEHNHSPRHHHRRTSVGRRWILFQALELERARCGAFSPIHRRRVRLVA